MDDGYNDIDTIEAREHGRIAAKKRIIDGRLEHVLERVACRFAQLMPSSHKFRGQSILKAKTDCVFGA